MRHLTSLGVSLLCGVVLCLNLGCPASSTTTEAPPAIDDDHGHDHGDHAHSAPTSLPEAIETIDHLADEIQESFAADDPDGAHGPLHDIGSVLEGAGLLVAKSDLTDEQKKAASEALKKLMDAYGKVDAKMHGDEGVDYADVSKEITTALEGLQTATGIQHDHDEDHAHEEAK
ncbi:hypothetical protein Poly24_22580 [Rosistilla carotiformis]|uniref:Uncharacterized protein n=1 Tax=Rosistilla carotiformis TaxID=2528017 RepID=A0A518JSN7_9BACT|nr:hypothetical protein [Rosistilla carotiformis]QDV68548.1 hypothetical protein Poly24_22580 [Rosistilla carotiformis]